MRSRAVGVGVEEGEWKSTAAAVRPAVLSSERAVPVSGRPVIMWEEWERARRGDCGVRSGCGGVLTAARARRGVGRIRAV